MTRGDGGVRRMADGAAPTADVAAFDPADEPIPPLEHDRVTVGAYGALTVYTYCLYALGPILAFLRRDLHLSYTLTSAHTVLWEVGTIATGLAFAPLVSRWGRPRVHWWAAAGTAVGAALFAAGQTIALTLTAALVLGVAGTMLQTSAFGVVADQHPRRRNRALVESTLAGSAAAVVAPVVLGALAASRLTWHAGMVLPVVAIIALGFAYGRDRLPPAATATGAARWPRLPARYWLLATLTALAVAIEFCVVFFAAQLLQDDGLGTAAAATALSIQYGGLLAGRVLGAWYARPHRGRPMLLASLAVTTIGFLAFWLSGVLWLSLAGLAVMGIGVANVFPLALSLAVTAAGDLTDAATAYIQLLAGVAVLVAPVVLGALADGFGIHGAFAVEPVLIGLALVVLVVSRPRRRATGQQAERSGRRA